jgi:hypothetical protein
VIEYDFDARFWNPITQKIKIKTLRNFRLKPRRHARVDEPIECWAAVGGRRLQIRKAVCTAIEGVTLAIDAGAVAVGPIFQHRSTWRRLKRLEREQLAIDTGFATWREAADYYAEHYGEGIWHGTLVTWGDREYDGPIPTAPQLRDLRVLTRHDRVVPSYGKISTTVGHGLVILKWAEVCDRGDAYRTATQIGHVPIRITELGRWILDRFEK